MGIQRFCFFSLLGCVLSFSSHVLGGVIPVSNVDWAGSRSQLAGEIIGVGNVWGGNQHNFALTYEVTQAGNQYTYRYTLDYTSAGGGGLSHFVIATSDASKMVAPAR